MLSEKPEVLLKEDNCVLSSWRHVVRHICDPPYNAFSTFRNAEKLPNICVTGAGLDQINGTYNLYGVECLQLQIFIRSKNHLGVIKVI
jgi:hypothetical protein